MKEKIIFKNNDIVSVSIYEVNEYPMHYHEDAEMIFLLSGIARVHTSFYTIDAIPENEFLYINCNTIHNIERVSSEPCIIMSIHFHIDDIKRLFNLPLHTAFSIASFEEYTPPHIINELRQYLIDIASAFLSSHEASRHNLTESVLGCFTYMINNFQWPYYEDFILRNYPQRMPLPLIRRAEEVLNYVQIHFREKLTLSSVADAFFLNKYYLSHLMKDILGMSFQNTLNAIRLNYALYSLLDSSKTIDEIAEESGFSSTTYMRQAFAKQSKNSLSSFRKKYSKRTLNNFDPLINKLSEGAQHSALTRYKEKYSHKESFINKSIQIPIYIELNNHLKFHALDDAIGTIKLNPQTLFHLKHFTEAIQKLSPKAVLAYQKDFKPIYSSYGSWDFLEPVKRICRENNVEFKIIKSDDSCCSSTGTSYLTNVIFNDINNKSSCDKPFPTVFGNALSMYGKKGFRTKWFYLYYMANLLHDNVIAETEDYIITRDGNKISMLCHNNSIENLRKELYLHIVNIECNYTIITYTLKTINKSEEDMWKELGSPDSIDDILMDTIRSSCFPNIEVTHSTAHYDFLKDIALNPGDIKLIRMLPA